MRGTFVITVEYIHIVPFEERGEVIWLVILIPSRKATNAIWRIQIMKRNKEEQEIEALFERGEVVSLVGPDGREVARGLANYGAQETARILRKPTTEIEAALGYIAEPELIHRDNLVVL